MRRTTPFRFRSPIPPRHWIGFVISLSLPGGFVAMADQGWEGDSLHVVWENDATRGSDRHYTQGARLGYLSSDDMPPDWMRHMSEKILAWGFDPEALKFGVEFGQEIYTPENLGAAELIKNDRPYAGWLYGAMFLQRRGLSPSDYPVMEDLRFDLGIIGPESQADDTQKVWHGRDPKGWKNQLKTEIGFAFRYDRSYLFRLLRWSDWSLEGIGTGEGSVGSVDIHGGGSALLRFGYQIPDRFEVPKGPTPKKLAFYMFGSAGGKVSGRNIFLDGNTWTESHHVNKQLFVGDLAAGLAVALGPVEISASNHFISHEFERQRHSDSYGSVTVTYKF